MNLDTVHTVAILTFLKNLNRSRNPKKKKRTPRPFSMKKLLNELGVQRDAVIGTYDSEENPDDLGPETYIEMQHNDGEVQGIIRLLTLPIVSTPYYILPAKNDKGERDFIDTVLNAPPSLGGMSTPLPFIIADMTRAISEGFRLYEKVARIIDDGEYKGKIGWKKLAPRDATTVELIPDKHGGFDGAHQSVMFGDEMTEIDIPADKCMLFTYQKEKHWLYGESILKTAYYHYDKKHKLYFIAHKKAEIEALGLKILKIDATKTTAEREAAEAAIDQIGINTRVTLPMDGVELEIERGSGGYDPLPLINHHNMMMARSALTQAVSQEKYAYPYGKGTPSAQYLVLNIESIMKQMEATLNTYAIAPLIDWNFGTKAYPIIKFDNISDVTKSFLRDVFDKLMKYDKVLPVGFVNEVITEVAQDLKLKWSPEDVKQNKNTKALISFEKAKLKKANDLSIEAPSTPKKFKEKLLKMKEDKEVEKKCYKLGEQFAKLYAER